MRYHQQIIHLHINAPPKPEESEACNGCGACCASAPCPVSLLFLLHRRGSCPALEWSPDAARYWCGMVKQPAHYLAWLPKSMEAWFTRRVIRWIAANQSCDFSAKINASS